MDNTALVNYSNPAGLIVRPDFAHVTEGEAQVIWSAAKDARTRLFIKSLWYTGLRISEVLRIRARDFNVDNFTLRVVRSKKRKDNFEYLPLPSKFGEDLRDYIKDSKMEPSNKLFPGHENTYRYQIRECARRAGIERWKEVHPHMFRHGFVYDKARKGIHPYVVSKLCGHSSLGITLQYYQPSEDDLRKAMEQ